MADESPEALARRLDFDSLAGADPAGAWLVLADPDGPGRQAAVERAAAGQLAALGPTVPPPEAHRSLRWARLALGMVRDGALPDGGLVRTSEHLATVILLQDSEMAGALVAERLAPLHELPAAERERLTATLTAWLADQRHTPGIAAELHVHPQTVRYRVAKLRELFGEALEMPELRFELALALRAQRALNPGDG